MVRILAIALVLAVVDAATAQAISDNAAAYVVVFPFAVVFLIGLCVALYKGDMGD